MANNTATPARGGLSLYANLLDPKGAAPGTISSAPVSYKPGEGSPEQDEAVKKQQALAASLRFQPTKRPQVAAQKAKAKAIASKFSIPPPATTPTPAAEATGPGTTDPLSSQPAAPRTTIADWTATASDDEDFSHLYTEKRPRGGRKKRKKNKEAAPVTQNWDDIYDPSRPNNYEEYKHSEEKIREVREWKDLLYRHRMKRRDYSDSEDEEYRRPMNKQFAPPPMAFAPPPNLNDESPPPPPPPADIPDDPTGEDAYLRRLRLTQSQAPPAGQISRAPVRYNVPPASEAMPPSEEELEDKPADVEAVDNEDADQPRSKRPGQVGFAERLMAKYGWSKGQGLGAQGTGIVNPLYAKADKRKKRADAEGGGYATPAGTGKILGGHKSKTAEAEEEGKFGAMSEVIRLEGMLTGLDLDDELAQGEGGIMQEIGEECGDKYGSVERVYIHRPESEEEEALVFVHFVSQLSALRAVNALEGRIFNGNPIRAKFWPKEKFDGGQYF
ncbi:G-patch domain containing protein [Cladophialophora carrionii]|uniref:G-patch domain containing protein n=1 Tax=Cladophialophora carrionii TaxID=86049 RepID=A0A1C1CT43_9EURO|nr:G-patch domain containing protein [Cladophialophora carrionii]